MIVIIIIIPRVLLNFVFNKWYYCR